MSTAALEAPRSLRWCQRDWIGLAGLVAAVVAIYWPVRHAGFIWDDDQHLTANPSIVGSLGFGAIWTSAAANYFPLVLSHLWVLHALFGLNPLPYHVVNVLLHVGAAGLLWRVLLQLDVRGAWLGAALWALHPVQVESVAWISEIKNTQSAVFFLLAILSFLRWLDAPSPRRVDLRYALTLLWAILAMLSKSSTVMLPVVLGLCWWWRECAWRWRQAVWLAPLVALSLMASLWTIWEQRVHSGATGAEWELPLAARGALAGSVVWFYLGKLLWPHPLIFIYPRWSIAPEWWLTWLPSLAAVAVTIGLMRARAAWARAAFFAFAFFLAALFPVLGFFDVYFFRFSFVSDHLQYLASMGPLALAGALLAMPGARWRALPRWLALGDGVLLLSGLGALSWLHSRTFVDDRTLWQSTADRNPSAWIAHNNLGLFLSDHGEQTAAIAHLETALRFKADYYEAHYNLANALRLAGRTDAAILHYETALRLKPNHAGAHTNLGLMLLALGRGAEALTHLKTALQLASGSATGHFNIANTLVQLGRATEAVPHYESALRLDPAFADAHNNLGILLLGARRPADALVHFESALRARPDSTLAHLNAGNALVALNEIAAASSHYEAALRLTPTQAVAHCCLGLLLIRSDRIDEAVVHFEAALREQPDFIEARRELEAARARLLAKPAIP